MSGTQDRKGLTPRHTRLLLFAVLLVLLPNLFLHDLTLLSNQNWLDSPTTGGCGAVNDGVTQTTTTANSNPKTTNWTPNRTPNWKYTPSELESYFLEHGTTNRKMRLDKHKYTNYTKTRFMPSACQLWKDPTVTTPKTFDLLQKYRKELRVYEGLVSNWTWKQVKENENSTNTTPKDLRNYMNGADNNKAVCDMLEVAAHPRSSLQSVFGDPSKFSPQQPSNSNSTTTHNIHIEPLLPPHRHPEFCFEPDIRKTLLNTGYIVHDFAGMCRNSLHHNSKTVFVDMGASFSYHNTTETFHNNLTSALQLLKLYQKFGFAFDHIYGFEITPQQPQQVYQQIPDEFKHAYHWFNVGVETDPNSYQNPFRILSRHFTRDDFVVVKLDIDTPELEIPLARQLLEGTFAKDDGETKRLADLVDVFYFEHHVLMKELASSWKHSMEGSMWDSLQLFAGLRNLGVAAHFWI